MRTGWHGSALALALAVLPTAPVTAAKPGNVSEWAGALWRPEITGAGADAAGRTLAWGHLELRLQTGRLFPVVAGERVVGAYFSGTATLAYSSKDPLEAASYRTNVRRVTSLKVDDAGTIGDSLEGALVMLSLGAEELAVGAAWREGVTPGEAKAAFAKHLERFSEDRATRYMHRMPQEVLDPSPGQVVIAELVAGGDDLLYTLDPVRDGDETLAVMQRPKTTISFLKERRYPQQISVQPVGRGRLDSRPRRAVLAGLEVTVVNPEGTRAEVKTVETLRAVVPVRILDLDLWSSHLGSGGARGLIYENSYRLESVRLADGTALAFSHSLDHLLVELPRTLAAGESVSLEFTMSGDVLYRPGNDSYWELGVGAWLPLCSRPDLVAAPYRAIVKVKKPFTPFSCGRTVRRWEEDGLACAEFREERPIQAPVVLAGAYTTISEERDGVTVSVSSYAIDKPQGAKKLLELAFTLLQFYRFYLNDYPFAELKIIEINDYGFGEAPPGVIYITKEAFNPLLEEASRLFSEGINARLAHELAHAWWGHVAMIGAPEDQWLSESVAQIYAALAMEKLGGKRYLTGATNEWKTWAANVKDHGTVYTANYLSGDRAAEDRLGLYYGKGALVLQALRGELGDEVFFTILKSYLKSFHFKQADTRNFVGLTNYVTKNDYGPWFERYLFGTEWPKR